MRNGFILSCSRLLLTVLFLLPVLCSAAANNGEHDGVLRFYLVRHGQTLSNVKEMTIGGGGNAELTRKGRYDASSLGLGLSEVPFIAAYSSTLGRAYQTANLIVRGRDMKVVQIDDLKDISWGDAEGGRIHDLTAQFGHSGDDFLYYFGPVSDPDFVSPVHAENMAAFSQRFEGALRTIARQHRGQSGNILVAAHSSMAFYLQKYRADKPLSGLSNTSVSVLEFRRGEFRLTDFNNRRWLQSGYEREKALPPLEMVVVVNPLTHLKQIGVMEGTSDSDFSPAGRQANQKIAEQLRQTPFIGAWSSALNRAVKTAETVMLPQGITVIQDKRLNEMFLGPWEAETIATLNTRPAAVNLLTPGRVIDFVPERVGERGRVAAVRFDEMLSALGYQYEFSKGRLAVFTHPRVLDAFLSQRIPGYVHPQWDTAYSVTLTYKNETFNVKDVKTF
ncbi:MULTISPECIES: histidine phosphatase family protein [unclassified Erwinia]|uniref:histidine phosphatase family protein n=1 Tax=unclassified Erwinia TaxID=2622719 RepID=UPI0030B2B80B